MPIADELGWVIGGVVSTLVLASLAGSALARNARSARAAAFAVDWQARVRSWWWMAATIGAAVLAGYGAMLLLFAVISFLALREFLASASTTAADHRLLVAAFYVLLPLQYVLLAVGSIGSAVAAIPLVCAVMLVAFATLNRRRNAMARHRVLPRRVGEVCGALMVCVYGLSFPMAVAISNGSGSGVRATLQMLFLLVVAQASDVFQFVAGKLLGRRPVAPRISPLKTVEGLLGGLAGTAVLGAGLWWLTPYPAWLAAILALLIGLAGFGGGLVLSVVKRARGIKDWGTLLPGHGGVLDRVDSLWLSAPLYYLVIQWLPVP